jgi:hypothetical protein
MNPRLVTCVGLVLVAAVGTTPSHAATKKKPRPKPITKTFTMQLAPVPDPPQGTSCTETALEGLSMHSERVQAKGAGTLLAKVSGFSGDWDITVADASDGSVIDVGSGTSTGGGAPAQNGVDTVTVKVKRATTFLVRYCNYAGTPQATGTYTFTYA